MGTNVLDIQICDSYHEAPDYKMVRHIQVLKNNHALFMRRACDHTYGTQADRIRAACDANNVADEFFHLTGESIECLT